MFQHQGIWLPDGEKHFPEWMSRNGELVNGKGTYQIKKLREAMKWCKQFRTAVDVGAHVGLWSMHLVDKFLRVEAFEPIPQFRDCFIRNVPPKTLIDVTRIGSRVPEYMPSLNYSLYGCALGARGKWVEFALNPADTGDTHVALTGDTPIPESEWKPVFKTITALLRTLDSFNLQDVDFIKIDCEGFELEVLKGSAETIARCKPCVIVEQKQHKMEKNFGTKGTPAVDWLKERGAILRREMGGDYILSWD